MTPEGDSVVRTLDYGRSDDQAVDPERLEAIAKVYDADPKAREAGGHRLKGAFSGRLPNDVGGHGQYLRYPSQFGVTIVYLERFRGDTDLAGRVKRTLAAGDTLADVLIGWFGAEMGEAKGYPALKEFFDKQLRRDLKDLALTLWAGNIKGDDISAAIARGTQVLVERGYIRPDEVPTMIRAVMELENAMGGSAPATQPSAKPGRLLGIIRRLLARKMGVADDAPIPESLAFLADAETMEESVKKYLESTQTHKDALARWEKAKKDDPDAPRPKPEEAVSEISALLDLDFDLFDSNDEVTVALVGPKDGEVHTNGERNEKTGRITWDFRLKGFGKPTSRLPELCYAAWSEPDVKAQEKRFGKVVLTGENLPAYCMWRQSMSKAEAAEWDAFVATLEPGEALTEKLEAFRFSDKLVKSEYAGNAARAAGFVDNGVKAIVTGLKPPPAP